MKRDNPKSGTDLSRRHFIRNAGIGAASATALPALLASCTDTRPKGGSVSGYFSQDDIILFQGDSITDAGREKKNELPNDAHSFGNGYAFIIKHLRGKRYSRYRSFQFMSHITDKIIFDF